MKIISGDRGSGRTTKLVNWLLAGEAINVYPGWSRAILCPNHEQVLHVYRMVRHATQDWFIEPPQDKSIAQLKGDALERAILDLSKCVWSFDDYRGVMRGRHHFTSGDSFEVAVDNFDYVLERVLGLETRFITTMTVENWEYEQIEKP